MDSYDWMEMGTGTRARWISCSEPLPTGEPSMAPTRSSTWTTEMDGLDFRPQMSLGGRNCSFVDFVRILGFIGLYH